MDDLLFNPSVFIDQKKEKLQPCLYADFGMPSAKKIVGGFRDRIGRVPHPRIPVGVTERLRMQLKISGNKN